MRAWQQAQAVAQTSYPYCVNGVDELNIAPWAVHGREVVGQRSGFIPKPTIEGNKNGSKFKVGMHGCNIKRQPVTKCPSSA